MNKSGLAPLLGLCSVLLPALGHATKCPNLMILLDKSGSMAQNPNGMAETDSAKRKWAIAVKALSTLVTQYDGQLPIGFTVFPSDGNCGAAALLVSPAYGTGSKIVMELNSYMPAGNTPTAASVAALAGSAPLKDASRGQFILLVTDGEPNCGGNPVPDTVAAIQAANNATPSIKTFVVGFGALPAAEQMAMNMMATAGGEPNNDPNNPNTKYYTADSDVTLQAALSQILSVVTGEFGTSTCDDSCYSNPCPAGQECIRAMCAADPCAGVTCPAGQYCYTDGVSKGACVSECAMTCGPGMRCDQGTCVTDPCGRVCGPGARCNAQSGICEVDPACTGVKCQGPQGCINGKCVDDPCTLVHCPAGAECLSWSGMCQVPGASVDGGGAGGADTGSQLGGCSCRFGHGPVPLGGVVLLIAAGVLLVLRRRAR